MNQNMKRLAVAGTLLSIPLLIAGARVFIKGASAGPVASSPTYTLYGVFRDFRESNVKGGHPDMGSTPTGGRGVYRGIAADQLNAEGDPVFAATGFLESVSAKDRGGRNITAGKSYLPAQSGETAGAAASSAGGAVVSADTFSSWFKDVTGTNLSGAFPIQMTNQNGVLTWDGDLLTQHVSVPSFGGNKVFGYTWELETTFIHDPAATRTITVGADDCAWLYVDGRLVIDLGGNHDYAEQTFDLARMPGLVAGSRYKLKLFYAERTKGASRLKFQTNLALDPVELPTTSGLND